MVIVMSEMRQGGSPGACVAAVLLFYYNCTQLKMLIMYETKFNSVLFYFEDSQFWKIPMI